MQKCYCNQPATVRRVQKSGQNYNSLLLVTLGQFHSCKNWQSDGSSGCSVFKWFVETPKVTRPTQTFQLTPPGSRAESSVLDSQPLVFSSDDELCLLDPSSPTIQLQKRRRDQSSFQESNSQLVESEYCNEIIPETQTSVAPATPRKRTASYDIFSHPTPDSTPIVPREKRLIDFRVATDRFDACITYITQMHLENKRLKAELAEITRKYNDLIKNK